MKVTKEYQVWKSTDSCEEFYSWCEVDKQEYEETKREDDKQIIYHIEDNGLSLEQVRSIAEAYIQAFGPVGIVQQCLTEMVKIKSVINE